MDNLGIVSFSARREYDDPSRVIVFARLLNVGPAAVDTVLTLRADDAAVGFKRLAVPAAAGPRPGEASTTFALEESGGAVLELRHNHADTLAVDDAAWLVLPPPPEL